MSLDKPSPAQEANTMVTETDRNKARSAVVSAYHALDCVTIPFSFLHAFADAAVDAVSTDAEPVAWIVRNPTVARTHSKTQAHKSSKEALYPVSRGEDAREYARLMGGECLPLYTHSLEAEQEENAAEGKCQENDGCPTEKAVLQRFWRRHHNAEPVKTAPAVAVKALEWYGEQAEAMARHTLVINDTALMAIVTSLSLDGGTRAKLALSAQVQDVAGWRSMDSAPKDGSKFLAICKTGRPGQFIGQCYYVGPDKRWADDKLHWFMNLDGWPQPTHWMPLPASPASKHGDAE